VEELQFLQKSGFVEVNGSPVSDSIAKRLMGYVEQEDLLLAN
jgi:hypothetical protein